jgi:hypothetical protein
VREKTADGASTSESDGESTGTGDGFVLAKPVVIGGWVEVCCGCWAAAWTGNARDIMAAYDAKKRKRRMDVPGARDGFLFIDLRRRFGV